jgi:uncharacterized lipoprotein YbaY
MNMNRAAMLIAAMCVGMAGCEYLPIIDNGPSNPTPSPAPRQTPNDNEGDAPSQPARGTVTGNVMLKVKMAVNPDAELVVELIEMAPVVKGQASVEPKRMGDYRIATKGKSGPWAFTIPYETAKIDQGKLYGVQAKIMLGDQVLFKSAKASMVLTNGKDARTDVTLMPAN